MQSDINSVLQQALNDHHNNKISAAQKGYEYILSVEPDNPNALHLLGLIEFDQGNYGPALKMVEKSLKILPNEGQWILNYGKILKTAGFHEKSLVVYQNVISRDPQCNVALKAIAEIYFDLNRFRDALIIYFKLLCDFPSDFELQDKYIKILNTMGKIKEALEFRDLLKLETKCNDNNYTAH